MTGADPQVGAPSDDAARAVVDSVLPGGTLLSVGDMPGSYSNYTHLIRALDSAGETHRLVLHRYKVFGQYDRGEKAIREFKTFELLQQRGVPAPRPLFLDAAGAVFGIPGIVTSFVEGSQEESPSDVIAWAGHLAEVLAKIHSVPLSPADREFLLDADAEVSWFNTPGAPPTFMAAHPLGHAVWERFSYLWPERSPAAPGLVHIDYWPGNILWADDRITAVVDWEEAAFGDPAIDVAYARMDMFLRGWPDAAAAFLHRYEEISGKETANLALWELAAAARPMFSPTGWIDNPIAAGRLDSFVRNNLL